MAHWQRRGPLEWLMVAQQVLDGSRDNEVLLLPLRGRAGTVYDYRIVAASPAAGALIASQAQQVVGLHVSRAYPGVADGPLWQVYRQVLATGRPQTVGPFSYTTWVTGVPAPVRVTAEVRRVGPGLLSSWVHHDEQERMIVHLEHAARLGNLGWAEADLITGTAYWSRHLYRIFDRDPAEGPMTMADVEAITLPQDAPARRTLRERLERGESVEVTYRIRLAGAVKHLRVLADPACDSTGRPVRVYSIVQDITAPATSEAALADTRQQLLQQQQSLAAELRLAEQLQHIILPLPDEPFDLPGLRVGLRYLPAEHANRIGGDWYHAASTLDGSVIIAVGDVAGHGIQAATTMAQLRHALTTLVVTTTTDPAQLLSYLNQLLTADPMTMRTATAVIAQYHPMSRTVRWAQAGHPAPLCTHRGHTTILPRPEGPLLGAFPQPTYETASFTLQYGQLLLLYTDGLVENRRHPLEGGLGPVIATLNRVTRRGGQHPLADLLAQLPRANPDDDTCVLAVRPLPFAASSPLAERAALLPPPLLPPPLLPPPLLPVTAAPTTG